MYIRFFWLRCVSPFRSSLSHAAAVFFIRRNGHRLRFCAVLTQPNMEQMLICLSLSLIAARCSDDIQKYLGITLLPQAGVALGMAATAAQLSDGHMVRNVVLFSVLVYELAGPTLTKIALTAAGAIRPEGRTSARVENKPEEVA